MKRGLNSTNYLFLIFGMIMFSGLFSSLKAEAVFLNDGSIIEGKIIMDTDKSISIKPQFGLVRVIQRKDLLRVLYTDDYKNKIYIYKLDNSMIEGYMVYEDKGNYTIRENITSPNELSISKEKVNFISKKKVIPIDNQKTVDIERVKEVSESQAVEEKNRLFGMDWGIGFKAPFYDEKKDYVIGTNWIFTVAALRIDLFFDFRFNITSIFSAGFETGINFFPNAVKIAGSMTTGSGVYSGDQSLTGTGSHNFYKTDLYIDIPLRAFLRLGTKNIYGQIFGGYYLGLFPLASNLGRDYYERGGELGVRVNLGGFFLDFSYIFENKDANSFNHFRVGLGYTGKIF